MFPPGELPWVSLTRFALVVVVVVVVGVVGVVVVEVDVVAVVDPPVEWSVE